MALLENALSWWAIPAAFVALVASYLYSYFVTYGHLKGIQSPFGAQLSNLWLLITCRMGARYRIVDETHKKLGKVVRIQPNHVSIADDSAIIAIYGHGNGFLKPYVPDLQAN